LERDELVHKGWRRHAVFCAQNDSLANLEPRLPEGLKPIATQAGTIALVVTYDCAVVCGDFVGEPWVQILLAFPCKLDKAYARGRHERRLHFEVEVDGRLQAYETSAALFVQVERSVLLNCEPSRSFSLDAQNKKYLIVWVAERFRRETWPDAFNDRLKPAQRRLKRLWTRYNNYVTGLYLRLNPFDEISEGNYEVSVIVAVEAQKQRQLYKDIVARVRMEQRKTISPKEAEALLVNEVITAFGDAVTWTEDRSNLWGFGIEIIEEESLTQANLKEFFLFSPYHLSLLDDPAPLEIQSGR
jgi:hypothetical protein